MDLKDVLGQVFAEIHKDIEQQQEEKMKIGTVSPQILKRHRDFLIEKEILDHEFEHERERMELEFKKFVLNNFKSKMDELNDKKRQIWEDVYRELHLDPEQSYSISPKGDLFNHIKRQY
jgi:hypothetical protein